MSTLQGLTQEAVQKRREQGDINQVDLTPSRSYAQILRDNVFTFVNFVLFGIGATLIILGSPADALTTAGLVFLNVVVGVIQEARAKHKLDQIALLARPTVRVIRDGKEQDIAQDDIVRDDLIKLGAGDQVLCDGEVVQANGAEMDESLLTGESDTIPKSSGDEVYSGSFCVMGNLTYRVTKLGEENFAHQMTKKARQFHIPNTPIQAHVNMVVRRVTVLCFGLGVLLWVNGLRLELDFLERVQIEAVVLGTIPQGLIFLVTLAYALGALRIARQGALVQHINAVESMSHVTVLCMDKTGTLTTNQITLHDVMPHQIDKAEFIQKLALFTGHLSDHNKTSEAIHHAFSDEAASGSRSVMDEIPFASSHKWSGLTFEDESLILGAPEVLLKSVGSFSDALQNQLDAWSDEGFRVVMFAGASSDAALRDADEKPSLPSELKPLGLVCLKDQLRPDVSETIRDFAEAGIQLKIISGDNPRTVGALARQAGFDVQGDAVSGDQLAAASDEEFKRLAQKNAVFGRIRPDQKEQLVQVLQDQGEYVAMIGDGVNDVMSLKMANVGIAMQSGSAAARNVSSIVLLEDTFAVLPQTFREGQRIVNGILDTMKLLLSRTGNVLLMVILVSLLGMTFPFLPRQDTLNAFIAAGLPPMLLTLWAKSGQPPPDARQDVWRFIFPPVLTVPPVAVAIYAYLMAHNDLDSARTGITITGVACGILLIGILKSPKQNPRIVGLILGSFAYFGVIILWQPLREFFALALLSPAEYGLIALAVGGWWGILNVATKVMTR